MSGRRPEATQVAFLDVAACFPEEEWKPLHEWQKDLYRNVMKEIHQALIALGPLIATTIFSLRTKEKEELCSVDSEDSGRRHAKHSPIDVVADDVFFEVNGEESLELSDTPDPEERRARDCHRTGFPLLNSDVYPTNEEPVSIFIDHLGAEVGESSTCAKSVVSLCIKEEEEDTYFIDHPDSKQTECTTSRIGEKSMNRKCKVKEAAKPTSEATSCNASLEDDGKVEMIHSSEKGMHSSGRLWSELIQELEQETANQQGFSNSAHFILSPPALKVERSETYNNLDMDLDYANLLTCPENLQHSWILYSCTECDKHFSKKEYLIRHQRTHMGDKPYQCAECEKTFRKKEYLVVHKRTHTGEKPYHCTRCNKRFSQKGVLNRHQRTHITKNVEDYLHIP
ncbi:RB-associated KRAB zinc finger protein-like [Ambystoma mexicanum]|uniref:RB-associated KRAB zinc finger protein-like n=1 Tax=Ambystoma mexicanum TaxID=8296 RepID=UPI0037E8E5A3